METTGQEPDEPTGLRTIKRYANRKLYDTRESRYVTLQQIAAYVRGGEEVLIIDNTTKEDLTNVTLAQIIYEEEKKGADGSHSVAPVGTLRNLIQQSDEKLLTTLRTGPVGKLITRDRTDPEAAPAAEEPKRSMFASSKEALDELQRLADHRVRSVIGYAITHVQQLQSEVGRLQTRIEELEAKLVAIQQARPDKEEVQK